MSTIIRRFMNLLRRNNEYTITIASFGSTGKTTMLYFLKLNEIVQTIPSIGFNVENIEIPLRGGKQLKFTAWDVGTGCGSAKIIPMLVSSYTAGADALIWMVDSTDRQGLQECVQTFNDVVKDIESMRSVAGSPGKNIPILMYVPLWIF